MSLAEWASCPRTPCPTIPEQHRPGTRISPTRARARVQVGQLPLLLSPAGALWVEVSKVGVLPDNRLGIAKPRRQRDELLPHREGYRERCLIAPEVRRALRCSSSRSVQMGLARACARTGQETRTSVVELKARGSTVGLC